MTYDQQMKVGSRRFRRQAVYVGRYGGGFAPTTRRKRSSREKAEAKARKEKIAKKAAKKAEDQKKHYWSFLSKLFNRHQNVPAQELHERARKQVYGK